MQHEDTNRNSDQNNLHLGNAVLLQHHITFIISRLIETNIHQGFGFGFFFGEMGCPSF